MLGNLAAMAHASAGDEIPKNTFANNAFEHYEIAAYKSLIKLCERAGAPCCSLLEANLREDQEMADWVDSTLKTYSAISSQRRTRGGLIRIRTRPAKGRFTTRGASAQ